MSKAIKKVTKAVSKVTKSAFGGVLGGDGGLERQAKEQARLAREQALQQQNQAAEQARAMANQLQTDMDRQRILAEQADQQPVDTSTPEIVESGTESAAERRRKFREPQVGGTGGGSGVSIRL